MAVKKSQRSSKDSPEAPKPRTGGRSARVVREVLSATLEVFAEQGYSGLSVEAVAARASVNKTTIYRRWPTKPDLVSAALRAVWESPEVPDTGSLRNDFVSSLKKTAAFAMSPIGRGLTRVIQVERAHPEVEPIARSLREDFRDFRQVLVQRGIDRQELPADMDARFLTDMMVAPIFYRLFTEGEAVSAEYIERVVDVVLCGVMACAKHT